MSEPKPPTPDDLPEHVLEELLGAFAEESTTSYDFDDPSIDRLLGITDEHALGSDADDDDPDHDQDDQDHDDHDHDHDDQDDHDHDHDHDHDDHDHDHDHEAAVDLVEPVAAMPVVELGEVAGNGARRVIVIAEDDRPDSVYLDEDKEKAFHARRDAADEGERSTIVIADLDGGRGGEPPIASSRGAGGIDPRIRARRISVRRAEGRRRLLWAGIGMGVVLAAVAAIAVFASPIFDVRDVTVQGATYTDADVLRAVVDDLTGEPVLLVDTKAAEDRLESVPWVESARVQTSFPHSVLIDIRERRALAAFQGGDSRYRVIDAQGRVLDVIDGQPADYVLITGNNPDTARGQFAGAVYASAAQLVLGLPEEIRAITVGVGVDAGTGTLTMELVGDGPDGTVPVRLGEAKNLDDKLAWVLLQVRDGLEGICALDASTSDTGAVPC